MNQDNFTCDRLDINIPANPEVIWGLLKPKRNTAKFKKIIACAFYFPPKSKMNSKLSDHLIGILQMLSTRYPGCGIVMGADKNKMNKLGLRCAKLRTSLSI